MAKFLLLTHIYPPAIDGGSRVIAKMGEFLQSNNHQVSIITTNCQSTDDFTSSRHSQIKFEDCRLNILRLPVITLFHRPFKFLGRFFPNFKTLSKGPIFSPVSCFSFLVSVLRFHPDYILAGPLPTTMVLYANFLKNFINIIYKINNFPSFSQRRGLRGRFCKLLINASFHPTDPDFQTPILLNTLKSADYIWTLTDFETNYFNKKLNIPKSKLILLGNGIDKSFIKKSPPSSRGNKRGFNLLFIGSFSAHKDIPTLITAFSLLPSKYTLTLAGQKTLYFPVIQKQIDSLPLSIKKRIKIITSFPDSDLSKLIDNCSILISPSTQESFGLVLLEALARGKPVIAADIPASMEIVKKTKGGFIFKQKDPEDLASKIIKLPSLITSNLLHFSSSYLSNHYTWDKIGEKLCKKLDIY
ncbi:MAG TPA: glycosyltransferase family 4 protein [Candidatus Woesebacteria bacterium]|nr:glycosyltransferase family 4 protein [Candidatus Woesebacteria bacterium]